jgi:hypothetical protein
MKPPGTEARSILAASIVCASSSGDTPCADAGAAANIATRHNIITLQVLMMGYSSFLEMVEN